MTLLVSRKLGLKDQQETAFRQVEIWANGEQKNPFVAIQAGWTSARAGWSIDPFGYVHLHGAMNYSGANITGIQTVATIGSQLAKPNFTVSQGLIWSSGGGTVLTGGWTVTTAGLLQIYLVANSVGTVQFNLVGLLYHPVML